MEYGEIRGTIETIVLKRSRLTLEAVRDEHRIAEDLGFDSLAFLMAVMDLERDLGVSVPLERIDDLRDFTFRNLVDFAAGQIVPLTVDD